VSATGFVTGLVVLAFAYSAFYSTPRRFQVYATGMASLKQDLVREARDAGIEEGLVFVAVSWGNRLLARTRGLGVPASVAERTYRRSDHCRLELLLRQAETERWETERTTRALEALPEAGTRLGAESPNGDPTLRLATLVRLPPICVDQIKYDLEGYGNFSPHLADNDPNLAGPLVIARDLRERNPELWARYPGRRAYLYRRGRFVPLE
jgi:hypothetical protein